MPSKVQLYAQMADRTAEQITGSYQKWTAFLTTAARLYKYPYNEQLMIFAQRPEATACAEYDLWNKQMRRYVRRGSKGIALVDTSSDQPKLRYVFDVSDTSGGENSRRPYLWEYRQEHREVVSAALEQRFDVSGENGLADQLERVAVQLVDEYWHDNRRDIVGIVDGSFLEDYDEFNIGAAFRNAAVVSTTYALLSRCGMQPGDYFEHEDFLNVFDFNTPQTIAALGTAISQSSELVLRQIEVTIKNYEREKIAERSESHERTDLHPQRGLSDSRPEPDRAAASPAGQVRQDAEGLPEGASSGAVEQPAAVREAVPPSAGDRRGSEQPAGTDDAGADEVGRRDGSAESQRPDEVGRADEHAESAGRGNDPHGVGVQLTMFDAPAGAQMSFFPSEAEQIQSIAEAESVTQTPSAFSMLISPDDKAQSQDAAQNLLYNSYNDIKVAHPDEIVLFQVGDFFEIYGEDAKQAAELLDLNLTTREIPGAGRVEMCGVPSHNLEMYVEKLRDKYDVTIAEAPDFRGERHIYTLRSIDHEAEAAINAYEAEFGADGTRVFRDSAAEQVQPTVQERMEHYRPVVMAAVSEDTAYRNACGHSDRENAEIECNAAVRRAVLNSKDMELIRLFSDVPEFRNHLHQEVFEGTYERLHDLLRPLSQDDIDDALRAWNGNIESKHAVVRYMQQHGREKETAAWLAREYGGKEDNNLFIIRAGSPETVELTWPKVQRRIAQLIREDNFYTEAERDNFDDIDPIAIREALAERGIVGGKVVAPEKLNSDPFIQRVMQDAERVAEQEEPTLDPTDRFHVVSLDRGFRTLYAVWDDETHGYYVDADGVTEEFTSEWQAEAYRLELQGQAEQALMERAKGLISDFCQSEYGSEADFGDPAKIGVAYTTVTDDEIPIQVNIDLVNYRLERYLDDEHLETRQYGSLQELMTNELENLDFSDLIHVSDEDVEQYRWHETEAPAVEHPEAVESAPVPQKDKFPYSVGDTVYLEDGKPFFIENLGLFDISLRDPSLRYPVSRVESRESFARLMERYPQPEQAPAYTEETVAVYPGDKNSLPYDVEIRTLRFDEPEHDLPAAALAKPEPPAMSEEEKLILEHEGQAALSEMGEFTPNPDDVISQAEIDGPPAHSPAVSILIDGQWQEFPSTSAAEKASYADFKAASHRNAQNFRITDDDLGAGGAKAKFQANLNAIQLLKHLEAEGLQASPEQQQVLSRYVGWGGLPDAFDASKPSWASEYQELKAALTPEEYTAARASTLNAHYTSPTVIRAIYEAVENMGFQTGNILEPSMGIGNFFGMLPENMRGSRLYGVELDSITGRIAKQLYPNANITIAGFETTDRRDFFDLAVGNVPFGQ